MNPTRLLEFESFWENYIDAQIQKNPRGFDLSNTPVNAHISIAMDLLEKVRAANENTSNVQNLIESHYGFGFIIDKSGRIISSNTDAHEFTSNSDYLADLAIEEDSLKNIQNWLNQVSHSYVFFSVYLEKTPRPVTWFASPININRSANGKSARHFLVTSVETKLSPDSRDIIGQSLGLSKAETEVAGLLAAGKNPKEIAALRSVKITAVRTQIVKIKTKMNAKDIPDIVRKFISMGIRATAARSQIKRMEEIGGLNQMSVRESTLVLRDGRRMHYFEQGHPRGRIILQIHSLISGVEFPEKASQNLVKHRYRMISPCRAGYGDSELNRQNDIINVVDESVKDLVEVLDKIDAKNVIVLTGWAGSIAQRLALKDSRVKAIVLSGAVPVWKHDYVNCLSPRYRTVLKTSIHAPRASPYLIRLGKALIDSGRTDLFIGSLDKLNKIDQAALLDKEVFRLVEERFKYLVRQSIWPFAEDLPCVHRDWTDDAKRLNIPVKVVMGSENFDQPHDALDIYKEAVPAVDISYIEGAGTYQNLTHFNDVLKAIREMKV